MDLEPCLDGERLKCLLLGALSESEFAAIEAHLVTCNRCLDLTRNIDEQGEAIFQPLRARQETPELKTSEASLPNMDRGLAAIATLIQLLSPAKSEDELGRIEDLRILRLLGVGGMGAVFLADETNLNRMVAVKLLLPEACGPSQARLRFIHEAQATAAIKHDNVVQVLRSGECNGVPYIVQELLLGESLQSCLQRGPLPINEWFDTARQILCGLNAVHKKGIIHRDIKPSNIWMESLQAPAEVPQTGRPSRKRVKLLDFGIARSLASHQDLTRAGSILGTPEYMSPEQSRGGPLSEKSDLFSLGTVFYQMLTGKSPFSSTDSISALLLVTSSDPTPVHKVNPMVPAKLGRFVANLMQKDPIRRPENVTVVLAELELLYEQLLSRPTSFAGLKPQPTRILTFLAVVVGLSLLVLYSYSGLLWRIETKNGTFIVEVEDESTVIKLQKEGVTIEDQKGEKYTFKALGTHDAKPGIYTPSSNNPFRMQIITPKGVVVSTDRFELKSGDAARIRVLFQPFSEGSDQNTVPLKQGTESDVAIAGPLGLSHLDSSAIPPSERFDWQPKELVAVIGEHRLRHWGPVAQVRFHPSGRFFVTCPGRGAASLYLTSSLEHQRDALTDELGSAISPAGFTFSQDGKWMFSANKKFSVDLSDMDCPMISHTQTLPSTENAFGLSDVAIYDSRWLLTISDAPGKLILWDLDEQDSRHVKTISFDSKSRVARLSWARDGRRLALTMSDGTIQIWTVDWTNESDPNWTLHDQQVSGAVAVLNPQGTVMATGGDGYEKIVMWDVTHEPFHPMQRIDGGREFAFSSDGKRFAVAAGLGIQLYHENNEADNDRKWTMENMLLGGMSAVVSLSWSPDQCTLVAGDQTGGIHVWDVSTAKPKSRTPILAAGNIQRLTFAPDGKTMIVLGGDNQAACWNLTERTPSLIPWNAYCDPTQLPSYSGQSHLVRVHDQIWNFGTNPPQAVSGSVSVLSRFSTTGKNLISLEESKLFKNSWELTARGRLMLKREMEVWQPSKTGTANDAIDTLQFDSHRFASRHDEETICVWDLTNAERPLFELKHSLKFGDGSRPLTLSSDGTALLAFSQQGSIVWDLKESPARAYPLQLEPEISNAIFSDDTKLLFVADGLGIGVYDWAFNREVRRFKFPGSVRQIVSHPVGEDFASVNGNGTVYLFRMSK